MSGGLKLIPVVMIATGLVLLWCAITDRNPIEVVKAAITGEKMPVKGSLSTDFDLKEPDFSGEQDQLDIGENGSDGPDIQPA
jgi:hypothetical protein